MVVFEPLSGVNEGLSLGNRFCHESSLAERADGAVVRHAASRTCLLTGTGVAHALNPNLARRAFEVTVALRALVTASSAARVYLGELTRLATGGGLPEELQTGAGNA